MYCNPNLIFLIQMGPLSTPKKVIPTIKRINQPYYSKIVRTVLISPIYVHNENNNNNNQSTVQTKTVLGLLPFNPVPEISVHLVHQIGTGHFGKNCCPQYRSFVFCLQEQKPNARWFGSGLCNRNAPFHWARGMSEHLNRNFLLNCTALVLPYMARQRARTPPPYSLCIDANFFFR